MKYVKMLVAVAVVACAACGNAKPADDASAKGKVAQRTTTSVKVFAPGETEPTTNDALVLPPPEPYAAPPEHAHAKPDTTIVAAPTIEVRPLEEWPSRHPDAAKQLRTWMRTYPEATRELARLDAKTDGRLEALSEWAITHRYESVRAFLFDRSGWEGLQAMLASGHEPAMEALLAWARRANGAALELAKHPRALEKIQPILFAMKDGAIDKKTEGAKP